MLCPERCDVFLAVKQGCKEIQLTAQDTASYGYDINESLESLLIRLSEIPGSYRIRIGMMNPRSVKKQIKGIIDGMRNTHIFKFIHLPVQSGDDEILHQMNRGYDTHDFISIVTLLRNAYPHLSLSTDIIVGFPGETEEQYQRSIKLCRTIQPDVINITRYSKRPFTKAGTYKGLIPTHITKQRSRDFTTTAHSITLEKNKSHIGNTCEVIVIEQGRPGSVIARTDSYKPVVIKQNIPLGTQVQVTIIDATEIYLIGMLK
jgi:MiaB/RimO family radical SAM methylthiotransferase